jgi:hypothetical protein
MGYMKKPYGLISPLDLSQALNMASRLEEYSLAPNNINILLHNCWQSDPYLKPSFDDVVRLDSGIAEGEGCFEMNLITPRLSTPSRGTTSKSSIPSRYAAPQLLRTTLAP